MSDATGWKRMRSTLLLLMENNRKYSAPELHQEIIDSNFEFTYQDLERLNHGKGEPRWKRDVKNALRESPGRIKHMTNNWPELSAAEEDGTWVYWLGDLSQAWQSDDHPSRLEGQVRTYITRRRVRDPELRRSAIAIHGHFCRGCSVDFDEEYEGLGHHCIEVHHATKDLANYDPDGEYTDPEKDLIPLCANCHKVITLSPEPISLSELNALFQD